MHLFVEDRLSVQSTYSSELTNNSDTYYRRSYSVVSSYYQAVQFKVIDNGPFIFYIQSEFKTLGYMYQGAFNPLNPYVNRITDGDNRCGNGQFSIRTSLKRNTTYILMVTVKSSGALGNFSIHSGGPAPLQFQRISKDSFSLSPLSATGMHPF